MWRACATSTARPPTRYGSDEEDDAFDVPKPKKPAPAAAGGSRTGSSSGGGAATSGSDKMQKVKSQVNEVIGVMHQNIEKVLDRGAKLDDIEDRTGTFSFFFFFRQRLVPSVFYLAGLKKRG